MKVRLSPPLLSVTKSPLQRWTTLATSATVLIASLTAMPAWAADPFRQGNQSRPIKPETTAVFQALFQRGHYTEGRQLLPQALSADKQEPLATTLAGTIAYLDGDMAAVNRYGTQTEQLAASLMLRDPLRGNLYQAVGKAMQAAFDVSDAGSGKVLGVPLALLKVQESMQFLERARAVNANDPELNLLQGYIEWALSSNLGLFSPEQARQRLETLAAPNYLSLRGVALVLRDQKKNDAALTAVDQALQTAPDNPELLFLKAQILRSAQRNAEGLKVIEQALARQEQLPQPIVREMLRLQKRIQASLQSGQP